MSNIRRFFLIACCFLLAGYFCQAQVFKGEIIGGINLTQLDGDYQIGYQKVGVHAGIGVMFPFNFIKGREKKPWSVSMEILYNQRGVRERNFNYDPNSTLPATQAKFDYFLKMHYVSVPILLHYTDKEFLSFGIGFGYNRLFNVSEKEWDVQQTYDTVDRFNPNDFTVMADIRIRIWQQLKFGVRFEYSMFSLRTRYFHKNSFHEAGNRRQYNNTLTFYLVYMLNEKKSETKRKKEEIERRYYYSEVLPKYY
jgi:hypothetical protein